MSVGSASTSPSGLPAGAACRVRALREPHPSRLSPTHPARDEILARHAAALHVGAPVYLDPASGRAVFTAAFLAGRGSCCDGGCRHCPYVGAAG